MEHTVEVGATMETIQVVLDADLLKAADWAAAREKVNRSALIRDALRGHLKRLEVRELEERDRAGYPANSASGGASDAWEAEAAWPRD